MPQFYDIGHNTAYTRNMPEICEIADGLVDFGKCSMCGVAKRCPSGDLRVRLGKTRAKTWPDVIACGEYPCFVVSWRFVAAMTHGGVRLELGGRVEFVEPIEKGLLLSDAPQYLWIDGKRHFAGKMNFDSSGFVDVRFCDECGNRTANIGLTYDRRHADPPPAIIFDYDQDSGLDLFTTDLSPTAFFCTDRVFECARQHRLTNLAFCRIEEGAFAKPLKY